MFLLRLIVASVADNVKHAKKRNVLSTFKKNLSTLFCNFLISKYFGTLQRFATVDLAQVRQKFIFSRKKIIPVP